jgi:hypothetical protein
LAGYRVYFGYDVPKAVILLAGGTKTVQDKDIETAKKRKIKRRALKMPLTRRFKETVMLRAKQDIELPGRLISLL